ncbi:trehalose-phosphatase [Luteimonas pelagia]
MPGSSPAIRPRPPAPADDWALFLDVDGCLLDFAATPEGVVVPPALLEALDRLRARLDGALALVSGRGLDTVDALFAPLRLPTAGLHGLERRDAAGHVRRSDAPPLRDDVARALGAAVSQHPGASIERKGAAIALHWRGAPAAADALSAAARMALDALPGYRLQPGDHVVELRPAGADKGDAIAAFLETSPFRGRHPVFAGDDLTDEHGFDVVNARGGTSVLVGRRVRSAARHHLEGPGAVRAWLAAGSAP